MYIKSWCVRTGKITIRKVIHHHGFTVKVSSFSERRKRKTETHLQSWFRKIGKFFRRAKVEDMSNCTNKQKYMSAQA